MTAFVATEEWPEKYRDSLYVKLRILLYSCKVKNHQQLT